MWRTSPGSKPSARTCEMAVSAPFSRGRTTALKHAPELARVAHVLEAEAGVDEHEPVGALDQQAVADQPRVARAGRPRRRACARRAGTSCRS